MEKLINEIKTKVQNRKTLIEISLDNAINNNEEPKEMFSNIKNMAKDNYVMVRSILGKELLTDIINFKDL